MSITDFLWVLGCGSYLGWLAHEIHDRQQSRREDQP